MSQEEASHAKDHRESVEQVNPQGNIQGPGGFSVLPGTVPGFASFPYPYPDARQPRMDIFEDNDNLLIVAEVPGVKPEQVDVEVGNDFLLIRGETPVGSKMPPRYRERTPGVFFRQIPLPPRLDLDRTEASCRDGLLKITIPKQQVRQGKNIQVRH